MWAGPAPRTPLTIPMKLIHLPLLPLLVASATAACAQSDAARPDARRDTVAAADTARRIPPLPVDSAGRAWVEARLAAMSLRQRVAQLVFPWVSGRSRVENPEEHARMLEWVRGEQVGGLIISTGRPAALAAKLDAAQAASRVPLLMLTDLETGPGMRLRPGGTAMPPAMAFGAADDTALARQAGLATAREARAVGIHMTLGPILDVQTDPDNPIINVRSFGGDPELVARLGSAWMAGAREGGLLSVGKHFPGHGGTRTDSHVGRAIVAADLEALRRAELVPFRQAVRAGIAGILVGHIAAVGVEGQDAPVASLSPRMVRGELREALGFEGLVVTDALNMGAVTREMSPAEASIRALLAGADLLLQPPGTEEVIDRIVAAVESGRVPAARIEDAARRVLTAKAAAGLHRGARLELDGVESRVGAEPHREIARRVAERAVTLVAAGRFVPIAPGARVFHLGYAGSAGDEAAPAFRAALEAGGARVDHARVTPGTSAADLRAVAARAREADVIVATAAVTPHQYRALGLRGGFASLVEQLAREGRPVIAVSFGSPYVVRGFPSAATRVLAWSSDGTSQRAAAGVLLGSRTAAGRLPFPAAQLEP